MAKEVYDDIKMKMDQRIEALTEQYGRLRAGRANPKLIENIMVNYYGAPTPIVQMASIAVTEARVIEIQPYDITALKEMEKSINIADLGIAPQNDGKLIRLVFPQLTEDTRKSLAKEVRTFAEDTKVAIRNVRREGNDTVKKMEADSDLTEDQLRRAEEDIQKITDDYIAKIDKISEAKEKEVMSV